MATGLTRNWSAPVILPIGAEVRRACLGPGLWPGPCRPALQLPVLAAHRAALRGPGECSDQRGTRAPLAQEATRLRAQHHNHI